MTAREMPSLGYIGYTGHLCEINKEAIPTVSAKPAPEVEYHSIRAPPRCSDCHIIGHKRNQCPNRNKN